MTILTADISVAGCTKDACKALLADCPTWRRVCDVTSSAQAAEKIYINSLPDPVGKVYTVEENEAVRPWALLELMQFKSSVESYSDGPDRGASTGSIELTLNRTATASKDGEPTGESHDEWTRLVEMIEQELWERNGRAPLESFLIFQDLEMLRPWGNAPTKAAERGVWQGAGFIFTW